MEKEFNVKVINNTNNNLFYKDGDRLDICSSIDDIAMNCVRIELRKSVEEEGIEGDLIASISGYYFDIDYMNNEGIPLMEIFDSIDQSIYDLYVAMFDGEEYKDEFNVFNSNLFYLDNIFVEEEYRQEGYASMLINSLEDILLYVAKLNVGVIVTEIYNFETFDNIDSIESLDEDIRDEINNKLRKLFINNEYFTCSDDENYLVKVIY